MGSGLWYQYLVLFSKHGDSSDLTDFCQMAVECAPSFQIWWLVSTCFLMFFSSPEHKVLKVSYKDQLMSGARRHQQLAIIDNSYKIGPILIKLHRNVSWMTLYENS